MSTTSPSPVPFQLTPIPSADQLDSKRILLAIKQITVNELTQNYRNPEAQLMSCYKHTIRDLLKWTSNFLNHLNSEDKRLLQTTTEIINKGVPTPLAPILTAQLMNRDNFLNIMVKKGFFPYLVSKYKPYVNVKLPMFIKSFEEDVKLFKQYFGKLVSAVYVNWLDDDGYYDFLMAQGFVEIISSQAEWKPVFELFLESFYDYKPRIDKSIPTSAVFFSTRPQFSCERQGSVAFERTISKMKQFTGTYNTKTAINMVKEGIFDMMNIEIQEYQKYLIDKNQITKEKGLDSDNRMICLEYCIFKLDKFISKSVKYLQTMYEQSVRGDIFLTEDHIMQVICAANRCLLFREHNGKPTDIPIKAEIYPEDDRIKLFDFKSFGSAFENPYQWREFKSLESYWVPVFSVRPVEIGGRIKIKVKGKEKSICLGVCSEKAYGCNNRMFEHCQEAAFVHVGKKAIYNCTKKVLMGIDEGISSVTMSIEGEKIDWCINDEYKFQTSCPSVLATKFYAFACLCRGAQFLVIDF